LGSQKLGLLKVNIVDTSCDTQGQLTVVSDWI
jgi:hypothetical protein